jgi:hypothetical protein
MNFLFFQFMLPIYAAPAGAPPGIEDGINLRIIN